MNLISAKKNVGILFHHFNKDNKFYKSPGTLDENKFFKFLKKYKKIIINPNEFLLKKKRGICLTFDDGLKCQYEIALPILEDLNIKAFFFVFTQPHKDIGLTTEIIRCFRFRYYSNQSKFYSDFLKKVEESKSVKISRLNLFSDKKIVTIKKQSPYYTTQDIKFKIIRDQYLNLEEYNKVIINMMLERKIDIKKLNKDLYMNKTNIKNLAKNNHVIGLHSHFHNHKLHEYSFENEYFDYRLNKKILEKITNKKIYTCSYPFGNFTNNTEKILKKLNIKYAFCKNTNTKFTNKKKANIYLPRVNISTVEF